MSTPQNPAGTEHELVLSAERLQHDVVRVPRERVRISKRITTEIRTLQVPVRVEQLVVRHEPVDGPGAAAGAAPAEDLVLVLHEEVPAVSLQVQPVERVRVRVQRVEGRQSVSALLSHEEVELTVEEFPGTQDGTVRGAPPGT
ncbi:DUF2382 domain-containing protein [Kineococcus glutinatus]|uniref:DUF2382 domain-containing protein n=1 Tax=Kineococcus glutinatus TaxID=1070872 RepID=A0ABP8VAS3_9ACTN